MEAVEGSILAREGDVLARFERLLSCLEENHKYEIISAVFSETVEGEDRGPNQWEEGLPVDGDAKGDEFKIWVKSTAGERVNKMKE
jgi:hypothetical protein